MKMISLICCLTMAAPALSDTAMSGAEFDAYSTGKTLYFATQGKPYGAEEYLDGRRVRWSFLDGKCTEGHWYESGSDICFVYENDPDPQCWQFFSSADGLIARFDNQPAQTELYGVKQSDKPMLCFGPDVGV